MSIINELKRRNVFRVAGIYAVVAWLLIQVSGALENSLNLPSWFDGVVTAGLMIGFPIALLLAWAFEMTPEGVKKTSNLEEDAGSPSTGKMDILILIGIIAVLGMGVWQHLNPKAVEVISVDVVDPLTPLKINEPETIQNNTIAVLPFSDLSQAGDQEYFSDGIAEEILNVLVRVDALKVTSRTSAFQFKGSQKGIPAIARELKVRHVLEGSVRKAGDNLRITAQLIDAQNDKHLWSETYDRALSTENIFDIQDEISNAIVRALKLQLSLKTVEVVHVKQRTENLSAYELYLQARPLFLARMHLDIADDLLIQALELDTEFADAWAMRAAIHSLNKFYHFYDTSAEQDDKNSLEFTNRALSLDPNNAFALAVRAFTQYTANLNLRGQFEFNDMIDDLNKSLLIEPKNTTSLLWLGAIYWSLGYIDESTNFLKKCIDYEPNSFPCINNFISRQEYIGNYQLATDLYLEHLASGLFDISHAPLFAVAQTNNKLGFMLIVNRNEYLKGWNKNEEIYQAYQNPSIDHSKIIKETMDWISSKEVKPANWEDVLIPIGYRPQRELFSYYDIFTYKSLNMNNKETKQYIKDVGIHTFWKSNGYPPQCRSLEGDDFECD
jgi:TolB-like protein